MYERIHYNNFFVRCNVYIVCNSRMLFIESFSEIEDYLANGLFKGFAARQLCPYLQSEYI